MTTEFLTPTYINIFLSDRLVCLSRGENGNSVLLQDPDTPGTIAQQPFAMAYTKDDRWLYGTDAIHYSKQYPDRAILSLTVLIEDEKEIYLADKVFLSIALLVYYFQEINRKVKQYLGLEVAEKYTLTLSNGLTLFQRSIIYKAMQMGSMKIERIHRFTDNISIYLEYTLKPKADPHCLCIFIDQYSCELGLYRLGYDVSESIVTRKTSTVSDASLVPYLASNLLRKYTEETGRNTTCLNYLKLVTESERILATLDVSDIRKVYFSEIGYPETGHVMHIDTKEIHDWITAHLNNVFHLIDKILVNAECATGPDEIWIDAEGISYTAFARMLARKFEKPVQETNGASIKGAAIMHGIFTGEVRDVLFLDSLPYDISILLKDGNLISLIAKDLTIPTKKTEVFRVFTTKNHIEIPVFSDGRFIGGQLLSLNSVPTGEYVNVEIVIDIDMYAVIKISSRIQGHPNTENSVSLPTDYAMEKTFVNSDIFTSELEHRFEIN